MADNFGLKIGIEGEHDFKAALRDINQSFRVLGSEMALATSQFDKNDKSVDSLTSRNTVLNKEIEAQKDKVSLLKDALENASNSFGENDRRTQNWQIQLNKAQAELNGMEHELSNNEKALSCVGDETEDTTENTDKLGNELEKSGQQAEESKKKFETLSKVLKVVGTTISAAFAAISAAAIAAGKALADMTVNAASYADEILTASSVTGMSTDSLQAYKYAAELVDVSMQTLSASMAKNIKSMSSARDGTGAAADAYRALGI